MSIYSHDYSRYEAIRAKGTYYVVTVVDSDHVDEAVSTAYELFEASSRASRSGKVVHDLFTVATRVAARHEAQSAAKRLLTMAHIQLRGNLELAQFDEESGLLEYYSPSEEASVMAQHIVGGAFEASDHALPTEF